MKFKRNELLKKHTSFRIGGPADCFCQPTDIEELRSAFAFAQANRLPVAIIGSGTNLLALDKGFRGLVIKLAGGLNKISCQQSLVTAEAGVALPQLLAWAARHNLGGLEFLAGIPGTVGGALVMNAGAWGKTIGQLAKSVTVINGEGQLSCLKPKQLKLKYRHSGLQAGRLIALQVKLQLRKRKKRLIKKKMDQYLRHRRAGQPLGSPNAGCIFKNPPGHFAGQLLEQAGCKGMRVGDAVVSVKHANFIVNLGEAKARDVLQLIAKMQRAIKIKLEPELKLMVKSPLW